MVVMLLVAAQSVFINPVFAHSGVTDENAGAPSTLIHITPEPIPPFEPDTFWAKVLDLLDARGGFITAQNLNSALSANLQMKRSDVDGSYFAKDARPWYGGFGYILRKVTDRNSRYKGVWESSVDIRWGGFPKGSPQCISMTMVVQSLEQRGGRAAPVDMGHDLSQPNVIRYRMPQTGATVTLGYADINDPFRRLDIAEACLLDLSIDGFEQTRD